MNTINKFGFVAIAIGIVLIFIGGVKETRFGSATAGLAATVATSSNPALAANTATTIIATSSCVARVVATASTTVMLTFTDKDTPTAIFGVFQAASTTGVYDASQYGCGKVKALSNAAGAITVMDIR